MLLNLRVVTNFFLLAFVFFLPLYEAPKNIFSVLFIFNAAFYLVRIGFSFHRFTILSILILTLLMISSFSAGYGQEFLSEKQMIDNALNWALMPLVAIFILVMRLNYQESKLILKCLCISTTIAITQSFVTWEGRFPELNSVGYVNQSALYLAFVTIALCWILFESGFLIDRFLAVACLILVLIYQTAAESIVGTVCTAIVVLWTTAQYLYKYHSKKVMLIFAGFSVLASALFLIAPAKFFGPVEGLKVEFDSRLHSEEYLWSNRDRLLAASIELGGQSLFGFGVSSFKQVVTEENLENSIKEKGKDWSHEKNRFHVSSHGHNLLATVLVERGRVGVVIFLICWVGFLWIFIREFKTKQASMYGLLAIILVGFGGIGQTTFHVEHGQLAFLLIALAVQRMVLEDVVISNDNGTDS